MARSSSSPIKQRRRSLNVVALTEGGASAAEHHGAPLLLLVFFGEHAGAPGRGCHIHLQLHAMLGGLRSSFVRKACRMEATVAAGRAWDRLLVSWVQERFRGSSAAAATGTARPCRSAWTRAPSLILKMRRRMRW